MILRCFLGAETWLLMRAVECNIAGALSPFSFIYFDESMHMFIQEK